MATQWTSEEIELLSKSESRKNLLADHRKQFGDKRTDAALNFAWDTREARKATKPKKNHKESTLTNYKRVFKTLSDESKELIVKSKNKDEYIRLFFVNHPKTKASTAKLALEYFAYKDHQRQLKVIGETNLPKVITREPPIKPIDAFPDTGETLVKIYNELLLTNQLLRECVANQSKLVEITGKQFNLQEMATSKLMLTPKTVPSFSFLPTTSHQ